MTQETMQSLQRKMQLNTPQAYSLLNSDNVFAGNNLFGGTFSAAGSALFNDTVGVAGKCTLSNDLDVTGVTTLTGTTTINSVIVMAANVPTTDPLVTGQVWNNAGVLTVSAG